MPQLPGQRTISNRTTSRRDYALLVLQSELVPTARRVDVAADSLATLRTALREELEIEQQVTLYLRHADGKDERVRDLQQLKQADRAPAVKQVRVKLVIRPESSPPAEEGDDEGLDESVELGLGEAADLIQDHGQQEVDPDQAIHDDCQRQQARLVRLCWSEGGGRSCWVYLISPLLLCAIATGGFYVAAFAHFWEARPFLMSILPSSLASIVLLHTTSNVLHPTDGALPALLAGVPRLPAEKATVLWRLGLAFTVAAVLCLLYEMGSLAAVLATGTDPVLDGLGPGKVPPALRRGPDADSSSQSGAAGDYPYALEARVGLYVGWLGIILVALPWAFSLVTACCVSVADLLHNLSSTVSSRPARVPHNRWSRTRRRRCRPRCAPPTPSMTTGRRRSSRRCGCSCKSACRCSPRPGRRRSARASRRCCASLCSKPR